MKNQRQGFSQIRFADYASTRVPAGFAGLTSLWQRVLSRGHRVAHEKHYSCLSATMGSTRVARRAGM